MAVRKKVKKEAKVEEKQSELAKLSFYVVILNEGFAGNVVKLLTNLGVSAAFIQKGRGTATRQIREILGVEDNKKEIIYSVVRNDKIEDISREIRAFFASSKKIRGISFSTPLTGIISMRMYSFLADNL